MVCQIVQWTRLILSTRQNIVLPIVQVLRVPSMTRFTHHTPPLLAMKNQIAQLSPRGGSSPSHGGRRPLIPPSPFHAATTSATGGCREVRVHRAVTPSGRCCVHPLQLHSDLTPSSSSAPPSSDLRQGHRPRPLAMRYAFYRRPTYSSATK